MDGLEDGAVLGETDGSEGTNEEMTLGLAYRPDDGSVEGIDDDKKLGTSEGEMKGEMEGEELGKMEGEELGETVGEFMNVYSFASFDCTYMLPSAPIEGEEEI